MRVLVVVASKHGSTIELAQAMGQALAAHGASPEIVSVDEVDASPSGSLSTADAVVLGSALYRQHWLEAAVQFAREHTELLLARPVWLFSSGPVGDPAMHEGPEQLPELLSLTGAREHRVFGGRLDRDELDPGEQAVVEELGASGGDYRDWAAVRRWAAQVAEALTGSAS